MPLNQREASQIAYALAIRMNDKDHAGFQETIGQAIKEDQGALGGVVWGLTDAVMQVAAALAVRELRDIGEVSANLSLNDYEAIHAHTHQILHRHLLLVASASDDPIPSGLDRTDEVMTDVVENYGDSMTVLLPEAQERLESIKKEMASMMRSVQQQMPIEVAEPILFLFQHILRLNKAVEMLWAVEESRDRLEEEAINKNP